MEADEKTILLTRVSKYSSHLAFFDGVVEEAEFSKVEDLEFLAFLVRKGEVFEFDAADAAACSQLTTPRLHRLTEEFRAGDIVVARSRKPIDGAASLLSLQLVRRATTRSRQRAEEIAAWHKARSRMKRLAEGEREKSKTWERRKPKTGRACKLWINEGRCTRVDANGKRWCSWEHPVGRDARKLAKLRWLRERKERRQQEAGELSQMIGESGVAVGKKLSKRMRSTCFVDWLLTNFRESMVGQGKLVVDVAGGRGDVSSLLHQRGVHAVVVDPRRVHRKSGEPVIPSSLQLTEPFTREWALVGSMGAPASGAGIESGSTVLGSVGKAAVAAAAAAAAAETRASASKTKTTLSQTQKPTEAAARLISNATLLVGMHPDQPTEAIIDVALTRGLPFALVPCCVFVRETGGHRLDQHGELVTTYPAFLDYLQAKDPSIKRSFLPFEGRSAVLWREAVVSSSS